MPTVVNRLKGTLSIGTTTPVDMEAQITEAGSPQTTTRDSAVTVLTGDVVQAPATYSWELSGVVLLDFTIKGGVFEKIRAMQGTEQPFTFAPAGPTGGTFSGTCIIDGFDTPVQKSGGNLTSAFKWPCQGAVTYTPPP
jgi:hypothetical protein